MKTFITEFLQFFGDIFRILFVVFLVFAVFFLYHIMLNFLADLISWEGAAIFVSMLNLVVGIFVVGKLNKEYDEVYAENRIKGLEDELKDREVYIIRLCDKIDKQDDLMQNLSLPE